jgi:WD40 repeat protein
VHSSLAGPTHLADFADLADLADFAVSTNSSGSPSSSDNPALTYSSYLGGKDYDSISAIAVDGEGYVYLTGYTKSPDFPTAKPLQADLAEGWDAFVAKVSPDGSRLIFSTYLGGNGDDFGNEIVLDQQGNIYVAGETQSTDFPRASNAGITGGAGAIQESNHGDIDAFLVKLDPQGNTILYSTYLGGRDGDGATGLALDGQGGIYLVGSTQSTDFPTANPLQAKEAGPADPESTQHGGIKGDLFIAKIEADGSGLVYSTYLGGSGEDRSAGIAVDKDGNAYVAGSTRSADFPTANPLQAQLNSFQNMFVAKLNPAGTALVYSTYLGGHGDEAGGSIAVDDDGNAYIGGHTGSRDFPTSNAFQSSNRGTYNLFVTKLNPQGSGLVFSTYLGGFYDVGGAIAVDSQHNVYVTGETWSRGFPTLHAVQSSFGSGNTDASLAKLDALGNALYYATFLGGSDEDRGQAVAVDSQGNAYVAGTTFSKDFPTSQPFQPSLARAQDAFIAKIPALPADIKPTGQVAYWWAGPLTILLVVVLAIALLIVGAIFYSKRRSRSGALTPIPPETAAVPHVPQVPRTSPVPRSLLPTEPRAYSTPPPVAERQPSDTNSGLHVSSPSGVFTPPPPPTLSSEPPAGAPDTQIPPPPPPHFVVPIAPVYGAPIPPALPEAAPSEAASIVGAGASSGRNGGARQGIEVRRWPLWLLWLVWVLANAAGGTLGALASAALNEWVLNTSPGEIGPTIMLTTYLPGGIIWLVLSTFQWLVLKLYMPSMPWTSAVWWVGASTIAGIVAVTIGLFMTFPLLMLSAASVGSPLPQAASGVMAGAIPGAVIGAAQWLVLQAQQVQETRMRRAGWWVGVNVLAWGLGLGVMGAVFGTLVVGSAIIGVASTPGTAMLVGGLVTLAAVISGLGLVWIIRSQAVSTQSSQSTKSARSPGRGRPLARLLLAASLLVLSAIMLALCALPLVFYSGIGPFGRMVGQFGFGGMYPNRMELSPDGTLLALANDIETEARILDADNNRTITELTGFRGGVQTMRWSPDGQYLATLSSEPSNTIRVWSTSEWQPVFMTDPGPKPADSPDAYDSATDASWSPDSKRLVVGVTTNTGKGVDYLKEIGARGRLKVYDIPSGRNSATLTYSSPTGIWDVAWSPGGPTGGQIAFVTQSPDGAFDENVLVIWDLQKGDGPATDANTRTLATLRGILPGEIAWSPDGKYIAVGAGDDTVQILDVVSNQVDKVLDGGGAAGEIAWSPDGKYLAATINTSSLNDSFVKVWDRESGALLATLEQSALVSGSAWSSDGNQLTTVSGGSGTKSWNVSDVIKAAAQSSPTPPPSLVRDGPDTFKLIGHTDSVDCIDWSPDGRFLAAGGTGKRTLVWDVSTGQTVAVLRFSDGVEVVSWSPDGKYLATGTTEWGEQVAIWNASSWQRVRAFDVTGRFTGISWSPDSKSIAASSGRIPGEKYAWVRVWDVASGKELYALPHTSGVSAVAWSPDGKQIATGGSERDILSDNTVLIWDLASRKVVATFQHDDYVTAIAWSRDGAMLASASHDKTVRVWDPNQKQALNTLNHPDPVRNMVWSPDGKHLASIAGESTRVWDVASGQITATQGGAGGLGLSWSPDRQRLAFGGIDHSVVVWELNWK